METRIKALEDAVKGLAKKADLEELRLSAKVDAAGLRTDFEKFRGDMIKSSGDMRIDAEKLRADITKGFGDVRADMHKGHIEIQRWMIATVIGLFLGFGGLFLAMSNALKPGQGQASNSYIVQPVQPASASSAPPVQATPSP